jgi:hypothetical protein
MAEHILFLTGKLAEKQLRRTIEDMSPDFDYTVHVLGVTVAALMTADMIQRRLTDTFGADRILVPGRCRGDLEALSQHFEIPVERGPEELHDLPEFFGKVRQRQDLSRYELRIFAEIVEAPLTLMSPRSFATPRLTGAMGQTSSIWAVCRRPHFRIWPMPSRP